MLCLLSPLWSEHDGILSKVSIPEFTDTTFRDQEVSKSETWIDKTEKQPKKAKKEVAATPAPVQKEEPKKKKKKIVVKEVDPPK
jgi:hypothetical protein